MSSKGKASRSIPGESTMPGLEDEPKGVFKQAYSDTTIDSGSRLFTDSVLDTVRHAMTYPTSAQGRIRALNRVIRHFADNSIISAVLYESFDDRELRSYELISLWEQISERDRALVNKDN